MFINEEKTKLVFLKSKRKQVTGNIIIKINNTEIQN